MCSAPVRTACQQCPRWALVKMQAGKHPVWSQSCCILHRESDRIKQVPGKLQCNTFSALLLLRGAEKNSRTDYLCLHLSIKAIQIKNMGFFLRYLKPFTDSGWQLERRAPWCRFIYRKSVNLWGLCQLSVLLRIAPEWKKKVLSWIGKSTQHKSITLNDTRAES